MTRFLQDNWRWLATGVLLTFGSSFGQTWFISLFAGEIRASYGLSDGQWGGLYTLATLCSAILLLSRGSLADTMPLSRLAPLVTLLFALAALGMALGQSLWVLGLCVFLLRFCGQGMFSHIAMTAMGRWFVATRGKAVALSNLGHPLGEVLLPLPMVLLIGVIGWRASWGVTAAMILLIVLPLLMILLRADRAPTGQSAHIGTPGLRSHHWTRSEALRHWLFPMLIPLLLTPGFIGTVVFFHQVHVSEVKGWSLTQMAPAYAAYATMTVLTSLLAGWACDRFGPDRLLPIVVLPMAVAMFMIGPAVSVWVWIAAIGILAITQGITGALWGAFLPMIYGTNHLGAVRSLTTAAMVLATAIGPGMTGVLIDWGIPFPAQGVGLGLWCVVLSVVMIFVQRRLRREMAQ